MFKAHKMQKYVEIQIESLTYQIDSQRFVGKSDLVLQTLIAQRVILEDALRYFKKI